MSYKDQRFHLATVKVKKKKEQGIVLSNHIQEDNNGVFGAGNRQQSRPDRKSGFLKRANDLIYKQIPCQNFLLQAHRFLPGRKKPHGM
jgi:hypothetical protein